MPLDLTNALQPFVWVLLVITVVAVGAIMAAAIRHSRPR